MAHGWMMFVRQSVCVCVLLAGTDALSRRESNQ